MSHNRAVVRLATVNKPQKAYVTVTGPMMPQVTPAQAHGFVESSTTICQVC